METTNQHNPPHSQLHLVTIVVNGRPVALPDHKTTGLGIKEAAIEQGVPIALDFALFRLAGGTQHQVRDDDKITVHEGQEFRAVAADDNSMPESAPCR